jgi:Fe-S oxidoreductase/nitrate reductase gamma subunit
MGICIYGFYIRIRVYLQGRPLNRTDNILHRLNLLIKNTLLQIKVMRVFTPGIFHACLFWSFLLLLVGTLLIMLEVDFTKLFFGIAFLKGTLYKIFSLTLDLAGFVLILTLFYFFVRRFLFRPEGLDTTWEDYLTHGLLFTVLITGFIVEGLRIQATELKTNPELAYFSPVGLLIAVSLNTFSMDSLLKMHVFFWWLHLILALIFIASLPFIKLRHIFLTSANYFFADLRTRGVMETLNLEDEKVQTFGVQTVKDFYWKDIFDSDACTNCKRCQERCPAYRTEKPLSPMKFLKQIKETAFLNQKADLTGTITPEVIWSCTTCFACQEICPANIEQVNKILEMRRNLSLMRGEFPGDEVRVAINNIEVNSNPFGLTFASRGDWSTSQLVPGNPAACQIMKENLNADILYFVGCYASFDKRNMEVAKSFLKICNFAGIKVQILGSEEKCCGEPVRKLGNEYLYQNLAKENMELFKKYKVSKIVTTCPHCFTALGTYYRDMGLDVEVVHHTVFINSLIEENKLKLKQTSFEFTYHDSCYLGRYRDIFLEPRDALARVGGKIVEMKNSGKESFCCGAGGGRIFADEKTGKRINIERIKMAQETKSPLMVSNCPFCLTMLEDGIKTANLEEKLRMRDMAEVVAERLI